MWKILASLCVSALLAVVALAFASSFIDWDARWKGASQLYAQEMGLSIRTDGAVEGGLFPPHITAHSVLLEGMSGGNGQMGAQIVAPQVTLTFSPWHLLAMDLKPTNLIFSDAKIQLDTEQFERWAAESLTSLPLTFTFDNASINWRSAHAAINSNQEPSTVSEELTFSITPHDNRTIDVSATLAPQGHTVTINAQFAELPTEKPADFAMTISEESSGTARSSLHIKGKLQRSRTSNGTRFWKGSASYALESSALWESLGALTPFFAEYALESLPYQAVKIEGQMQLAHDKLALKNSRITSGTDALGFDALISLQSPPAIQLKTDVEMISLDAWLPYILPLSDALNTHQEKHRDPFAPRAYTRLSMQLTAKNMLYQRNYMQDVSMRLEYADGEWLLQEAKAKMPGDGQGSLFGQLRKQDGMWVFSGSIDATGKSFKTTMDWLPFLPDAPLPDSALGEYHYTSNIRADANSVRLSEAKFTLGDIAGRGTVIILQKEGELPLIEASLRTNILPLDQWMQHASLLPQPDEVRDAAAPAWLQNIPYQAKLSLATGRLEYRTAVLDNVRAKLTLKPKELRIEQMVAQLNDGIFSTAFLLRNTSDGPTLALKLHIGELDTHQLQQFLAGHTLEKAPYVAPTMASGSAVWSETPLDLRLLHIVDGSVELSIDKLIHDAIRLENAMLQGSVKNRMLEISAAKFNALGGTVEGSGTVGAGALPAMSAAFSLSGVDIGDIVRLKADAHALKGRLSLSATARTSGASPAALMRNLQASGGFFLKDLDVYGFDLNAIARKVIAARTTHDVSNLARVALAGGKTTIRELEGRLSVTQGVLEFPVTSVKTDYSAGSLQGAVRLPDLYMNMQLAMTPINRGNDLPPVTLQLQGPIQVPERSLNTTQLENYIAKRAVRTGTR